MLSTYDWIYGSAQLGAVLLSIASAIIAISLLKVSHNQKNLHAWRALLIALLLFTLEEIFGALRTFGVYSNPWITHVLPSVILALLIIALTMQININRGWTA